MTVACLYLAQADALFVCMIWWIEMIMILTYYVLFITTQLAQTIYKYRILLVTCMIWWIEMIPGQRPPYSL